jgi:tRNA(Glu) U13 pseudouridine synthase TruD
MVLHGRIENGAIVLPTGLSFPDGTEVTVIVQSVREAASRKLSKDHQHVKLPLVGSQSPGSRPLTADRIAEILDDADLST